MREVAWVVFDEIHYMRDASKYSKITAILELTDALTMRYSSRCGLGRNHYSPSR